MSDPSGCVCPATEAAMASDHAKQMSMYNETNINLVGFRVYGSYNNPKP